VPRHPSLNASVRALLEDVAARMPEFAHVRPGRILIVAGEARRSSHASIRPLHWPSTHTRVNRSGRKEKPLVKIRGRTILYVITLRPLWFRRSTPEARVGTLLHELFHISTRFDGTLHAGRRHGKMGTRFYARLGPLVRRYLRRAPRELLAPFGHHGLVRVARWLERPPASYRVGSRRGKAARRLYTEEQLFLGLERMLSSPAPEPG
jgi:predicted metallopeptidase